jgi:membrane-bound lytic murein transglycosylase D
MSVRVQANHALIGLLLMLTGGCVTTEGGHLLEDGWNRVKDWTSGAAGHVTRMARDDDTRAAVLESVRSWFGDAVASLGAPSIEQIAAYADEAQQLAAWADQYEALAPFGAWMAARLDYYEAARDAVARVPAAPQPPVGQWAERPPAPLELPHPPPPKGTITVRPARPSLPPPRPPRKPARVVLPPAPIEQQRIQAATQIDYWRRKVASHPLPPNADELAPKLQRVFREEQVPEGLVWLAEVESRFNPGARSPAGAVGLYQLMPATARSLGLTTSHPDQRLDPESNARAAARYLRQLHRRFGSWPIALAAYNCGQGRVAGELKRVNMSTYESIAFRLPLETQMYVPRVQETIRLRTGNAL